MEGEATGTWEIFLGLIIFAGVVYGAMRYAKHKKANRKPGTGGGGGGGKRPGTDVHKH